MEFIARVAMAVAWCGRISAIAFGILFITGVRLSDENLERLIVAGAVWIIGEVVHAFTKDYVADH